MRHQLAEKLIIDSAVDSGVAYTRAVTTGGKAGVRVEVRALYSQTSLATIVAVEQSVDLINWSTPLFSTGTIATAPSVTSAKTTSTSSAVLAGYVRLKFTNGTGKACYAASVEFFDFAP